MSDNDDDWRTSLGWMSEQADSCSQGPHRPPQGPNEDLAQCFRCGSVSWAMRPWGETFGHHIADCSLPIWHEAACQPGGAGHPVAAKVRG